MTTEESIDIIKDRLVSAYRPVAIYIFGSRAWGSPSRESDIDIAIIINKSEEKFYKRPILAYHALKGLMISKDILVFTSDEFNELSSEPASLCHMIKEKGIKLYEAA